jgi:hypothetical protein
MKAMYNYYPTGYSFLQQPQAQSNGLTWVQGEAAAKSWYVSPNTTVALWDSEAQVVYIKSADVSGMPSMKALEYTIRGSEKPVESVSLPQVEYLTKNDLEAVYEAIRDLRDEIDNLSIRRSPKKKEVEE